MLEFDNKIQALLSLVDDTDMEVYSIVTDQLCQYGKRIIPHLEDLWENTIENEVQERIELLIHQIQYNGLRNDFRSWKDGDGSLMDGALLVARYQYPDLDVQLYKEKIWKLWKTVWLELNEQLTSIEQLHIVNSILYHFYKLEGVSYNHKDTDLFLLNKVLDRKKGNALSNGILFQVIAEEIGLPVMAVHVPKHYLLAFFRKEPNFFSGKEKDVRTNDILFFIDATTGSVYNKKDMLTYLEEQQCLYGENLFQAMKSTEILSYLIGELSNCFNKQEQDYKKTELLKLVNILSQKD